MLTAQLCFEETLGGVLIINLNEGSSNEAFHWSRSQSLLAKVVLYVMKRFTSFPFT
jgi:hypothetical protein